LDRAQPLEAALRQEALGLEHRPRLGRSKKLEICGAAPPVRTSIGGISRMS
jgi:hypothetical protein